MVAKTVLSVDDAIANVDRVRGLRLAKGKPFAVCWFERQDGAKVYSLRSTEDGIDVSEIAKRHGGGGHPVVGAISLPAGDVERAQKLAREIAEELAT